MDNPRTVRDLMNNFRSHYRNSDGDVIVHFEHTFHVMSEREHQELEEAVLKTLMIIESGVDDPDPITKFAIMVLAHTY
jgi:hypothetical protein